MSGAQVGKAVRWDVLSGAEAYENAPYPWDPHLQPTFPNHLMGESFMHHVNFRSVTISGDKIKILEYLCEF